MTAQQLKNSILQMAVQGKLVPQDPNDEPASVLLERIRTEKERLIKEKKIKREKNPSVIFKGADNTPYEKIGDEVRSLADEVPFDIPDSWEWVRIRSLGEIVRGSGIKRNETVQQGLPCVRYGELYTTYQTSFTSAVSFIAPDLYEKCKHFSYGDVLMTLTGENKPDIAKAVAYLGTEPIAASGDLAFWTQHGMNPLFLSYIMASPYIIARKVALATGDIIVHISGDKLGTILLPVPPLAEQERIVACIQEAELVIENYAIKATALQKLQDSFPEALKKSILQEAVQGKLVPQDPSDEPAEALLERIRAEKHRLIKEGKIKKDKHESVIFRRDNSHYEKRDPDEVCIDDALPFEIPENWTWARLSSACVSIADGDHQPPPQVQDGIPFLVISNVSDGRVDFSDTRYVPKEYFDSLAEIRIPQCGDLLFTVTGSYGIVIPVQTERKFCFQRHIALIKFSCLSPDFMKLWLSSPLVYEQCRRAATGTAQKTVGLASLKGLLIPIPPLNEQKRIVQKLNTLLALATL
ncbi:restriction endonuclease subunit S [Candidatus Agathobaculum pullicola]|uniref:restriction endonuclease subunit S n=1 Tax=Candidatus Agathobaculum pullicola TaxID=2838426 RepID=UPI003F913128